MAQPLPEEHAQQGRQQHQPIFVVEPGMKGTWEVVETVRKYFVFA